MKNVLSLIPLLVLIALNANAAQPFEHAGRVLSRGTRGYVASKGDEKAKGQDKGKGEDKAKGDNKINGLTPEEFYKQFHYKEVTSKEQGTVYHQILTHSHFNGQGIELAKGISGHVELAINPDGTYNYRYTELKSTGPGKWDWLNAKAGKGNWSIKDNRLILEGLGEATGGVRPITNSEGVAVQTPVMSFRFSRDIGRPGLTKQTLDIIRIGSTGSPRDWADVNYEK